jgi:hypothetical protein
MRIHGSIQLAVVQPYRLRRERDPGRQSVAVGTSNCGTYQEHRCRYLNLTFWTEDRNYIGRSFLVWETDPTTGLVFDIMDEYTFVPE